MNNTLIHNAGISNGIYVKSGKYYMMCGKKDYPINVIPLQGRRIIGTIKRTPVYIPIKRTPIHDK